jgi:hypothetical protein
MTNQFSCFNNNLSGLLPLQNIIDNVITINGCDFIIRPRTEKGWTVDLVFNGNGFNWSENSIFYYLGINDESLPENYIDNNLSFWLTSDRKIKWKTYKFISETQNKLMMDETVSICSGITTDFFNVTITFERNREFELCDLVNMGGSNDLIVESKVLNPISSLSGDTELYEYVYGFEQKWIKEVENRLGTLKIYVNGKPLYKLKNWEEIIPTQRNSTNQLIQSWGTGTTGCNDIHNGTCNINIVEINYYEEPLSYIDINKIIELKPYDFNSCNNCSDNLSGL